jgi:predicted metalloprotease with PDZ domain
MPRRLVALLCASFVLANSTAAIPATAPPPRNTPYPGTISLRVDATDLDRRLFSVRESLPVRPGPLTLFYPQWLPGNHAPRGPIEAFAGLTITAGEQRLAWTRDPLDVYTFKVQVPPGVHSLDLQFQFASPQNDVQGRIAMTPEILGVQWEKMLLYPAGHVASRITFEPSVTLPEGWRFATALETEGRDGDTVRFRPTTLETLVDSPLFAGKHFARFDLDPGAKTPVRLNVVGDSAAEVEVSPEQLDTHRRLLQEEYRLFGSKHFDHYDFLLAVSDNFGGIGLEHHRSSENGVKRGYFREWDKNAPVRDLLAHEMSHSWNGKFRRPADLWTPNYNTPMQTSLLWVYEGQTQYWGQVLAARSGLWSADIARGALASVAATLSEKRQGRAWRDLEDTTNQPIVTARRPLSWVSWQRTEDYYNEGLLIWLDVDTKLRELSGERRSLDDFARVFFGVHDGSYVPATYTFDDVVAALDAVAPFDWAHFLRERTEGNGPAAPLGGIERSGWRLVYREEPSELTRKQDALNDTTDLSYSLGLIVGKEAKLTEVVWQSPAFKAGVTTGGTLIAVNGIAYKSDLLKQAIREAKTNNAPIELLVKTLDRYRTLKVDYSGGLRYPHLERIESVPDRLSDIQKPRSGG